MSKVTKENFRLLDLSTDEESEDLQLEVIPSRKKKVTRRERYRNTSSRVSEPHIATELQCALRWALRGTLLLWLLMLTWICAALYDQVSTMKLNIAKVSTSSDGVGDALQLCHTAAKELRANASDLSARLLKLELDHQELVKRVEQAAGELASVSEQLSAAPKLADTPRRLAELQRTVADFGSQINGFDGAINFARKQAVAASSGVEEIRALVHDIQVKTNETVQNLSDNTKKDEELKQQVLAINSTISGEVEQLRTKVEQVNKPTSTMAPTSTTTSTTTSTSTTTPAPSTGPPMKPNFTH